MVPHSIDHGVAGDRDAAAALRERRRRADLAGLAGDAGLHPAHGAGADRPVRAAAAPWSRLDALQPGLGVRRRRRRRPRTSRRRWRCSRPGILFFTVHYLMLRGFYALERTRTVFWVQCVIAAVNIAARAACWSAAPTPSFTSPGAGAGLHRRVRRRRGVVVLPAAAPARRPRAPRAGPLPGPAAARRRVRPRWPRGAPAGCCTRDSATRWSPSSSRCCSSRSSGSVDGVVFLLLARLMRIARGDRAGRDGDARLRLPGRV